MLQDPIQANSRSLQQANSLPCLQVEHAHPLQDFSTGYTFSYYALALAVPPSILNFVLVGALGDLLDNVCLPSWNVIVAIWVVFSGASPISFTSLRCCPGSASLLKAFKDRGVFLPLMSGSTRY